MAAALDTVSGTELRVLAAQCRDSIVAYSVFTDPAYRPNLFHRYLASRIEAAVARGHGRIIVHAPPQTGKSELVSRKAPAWVLGRHPNWPIIAASYGEDLALLNGQAVRDAIGNPFHQLVFPESQLNAASTAKDDFLTTEGGHYLGTTVGGSATGFPGKFVVIDDPFKNREDADSPVIRKKVKDWYRSVIYTRLAENSILIIMHTRWHEDDLAGWLLAEQKHEDWEHIHLPALAEDDDILGRKRDEPLVPERFSKAAYERIRQTVGDREWLALYQGRPRPEGGGEFKESWLQFYGDVDGGRGMNKVMLVDPAHGKRTDKDNDYTAIWVIGLSPDGNYYALDFVRDRMNLAERTKKVFQLHRKWRPNHPVRYERYGLQSDIEHIKSEQERTQYRFPIIEVAGPTKKEDRIRRAIPMFSLRRFYLPGVLHYTRNDGRMVDLVHEFIHEEYKPFPVGKHDDMLDALARLFETGPEYELDWPGEEDQFERLVVGVPVLDPEAGY